MFLDRQKTLPKEDDEDFHQSETYRFNNERVAVPEDDVLARPIPMPRSRGKGGKMKDTRPDLCEEKVTENDKPHAWEGGADSEKGPGDSRARKTEIARLVLLG